MERKIQKLTDFLAFLLKNKSLKEKEAVLKRLRRALLGEEVKVVFAREFDRAVREEIESSLKKVLGEGKRFKFVVKPEIIGGFLIETKNRLIDRSIEGAVKKLWKSLRV
jgi:F0F1-type ATP synthase delta subunit